MLQRYSRWSKHMRLGTTKTYLAIIPLGCTGSFWGYGENIDEAADNAVKALKRDADYDWFVENMPPQADRISVYDITDIPDGEGWYADAVEGIMRSDTEERIERHSIVSKLIKTA